MSCPWLLEEEHRDLRDSVLRFLCPEDLQALAATCRYWRNVIELRKNWAEERDAHFPEFLELPEILKERDVVVEKRKVQMGLRVGWFRIDVRKRWLKGYTYHYKFRPVDVRTDGLMVGVVRNPQEYHYVGYPGSGSHGVSHCSRGLYYGKLCEEYAVYEGGPGIVYELVVDPEAMTLRFGVTWGNQRDSERTRFVADLDSDEWKLQVSLCSVNDGIVISGYERRRNFGTAAIDE